MTWKCWRLRFLRILKPKWLSEEDEKKEIQNILDGQPTYPDVPDIEQAKTKPLPNQIF